MNNSRLTPGDITALANAELEAAGERYRWSRYLQIATLATGVVSVFVANPWTYVPALIALGTQVLSWVIRYRATKRHSVGDEGRIRGLLLDAIGPTGERVDHGEWLSRVNEDVKQSAQGTVDPDYFASKSRKGMRRLCDNLQENAFWAKHQYRATAAYYLRVVVISVVGVVVAVLIAIPLVHDKQSLLVARLLVVALASGAAVTQVSEILSWRAAEIKSEALDRRLDAMAACSERELKSERIGSLLSAYGDYCVATSSAPPVPHFIYIRQRDRLNNLWKQRMHRSV